MESVEEERMGIFVLPYLSLISEKEKKIEVLLSRLDLKLQSIHSHKRSKLSEDPPNVVLCTIEKANALINGMIESQALHRIKSIVVDELHLVGEDQRGYLLELLLTKV